MLVNQRYLAAALTLSMALAATAAATAQSITLPRSSPHSIAHTTLGLTEVTIDYHSPGVKGREVWGTLVPYDTVWRAGANENTTITFSHPVRIEGQDLDAGTYGLHMIPTGGDWTVIFSRNHTSWGSFSYDPEEDALRVTVTPEKTAHEEWLRYSFTDLTDRSATTYLAWEKVRVPFEITTDTPAVVLANARNELRSLPGFSWQGWFQAASYAQQQGVAAEEALGWIDRSIRIEERFQNLRVKAQLLQQAGRGEEAEQVTARAMEIATEVDINALGYQHLNAGEVARAIEVFQKNLADHPDSWNCHDSLGEAYAANQQIDLAIASYHRAREMAPEGQKARIESILESLKSR